MTASPRSGEYSAPTNQFHRLRDFVSPDFKNVVRISRSPLWSTAFLDLDAEPVVLSHPAANGHYLVVQVMDHVDRQLCLDRNPHKAKNQVIT